MQKEAFHNHEEATTAEIFFGATIANNIHAAFSAVRPGTLVQRPRRMKTDANNVERQSVTAHSELLRLFA